MRYTTYINNVKASEWGLTLQQAYVFSFLYELPSWANHITIKNEVYYFAYRGKACKEIPLITDKPDTMYRYYKQLEHKGLVRFIKIEGKDYVSITNIGKQWNGKYSEQSENNNSKLGKSYKENNPTYNNTRIDKNTKDTFFKKEKNSSNSDIDNIQEEFNPAKEHREKLKKKISNKIRFETPDDLGNYIVQKFKTRLENSKEVKDIPAKKKHEILNRFCELNGYGKEYHTENAIWQHFYNFVLKNKPTQKKMIL